jgi:hypothetical protein
MSNVNDELQIFYGEKYEVTDHIVIKSPTISEIKDYGENNYFSLISMFVSTPFDMIAQLDTMGIDFTKISAFEMFCLFSATLNVSDTKILFGEVEFSKYEMFTTDTGIELRCGKSVISEPVYHIMTNYLRKMHLIPPPKYEDVGNEYTKQKLIEYAYDDLKFAKKKKRDSPLRNYISFIVARDGIQSYRSILDLPINAFFEILTRKQNIESIDHIYTGIYTGNIDANKISKKELNYFRSLS